MIKLRYSSVDRVSKRGSFKTLEGARKWAQRWVGEAPDLGGWYAVSFDGVGKVEVISGCQLVELFPRCAPIEEPDYQPRGVWINGEFWPDDGDEDYDADPFPPDLRGPGYGYFLCHPGCHLPLENPF